MTDDKNRTPELPSPGDRMGVNIVDAPHPATLPPETLMRQCELRTQRRSGPGGQHRNKTSSGVFLHHQPTGIVAEATERRSQADNRAIALARLRLKLAVEIRTPSTIDSFSAQADHHESSLRASYGGGDLRINDRNEAKPAVLALILNDLHAVGGQPSAAAKLWHSSTSAVVRLVKSHPPAFQWLNQVRQHHRRKPLK